MLELSIREKIGQMLMFGVNSNNIDCICELIREYGIGGVILYRDNYSSYEEMLLVIKKLKESNKYNKIPLFIAIDQEGGRVNRMPLEVNNIKSIWDLSKLNDLNVLNSGADIISEMLIKSGINMNFSPVLDIYNDTENKVLYKRCFSNNIDVVSEYGINYMNIFKKNGIISVVKHFPGHGASNGDSHFLWPYIHNYKSVLNKHIIPFEKAINSECDAIMVGHLIIRKLTGIYPASLSKPFVKNYLRDMCNYDGVVITDDVRMGLFGKLFGNSLIKKFFETGIDIAVVKYKTGDDKVINNLVDMVDNGDISIQVINKSVDRIIRLKKKYKINDDVNFNGFDINSINRKIEKINKLVK